MQAWSEGFERLQEGPRSRDRAGPSGGLHRADDPNGFRAGSCDAREWGDHTVSRDGAIVALVDDDPSILRSLARLLTSHGFDVRAFSSPSLFLSEVASLEPSCLVLDLSMPELSGIDVQQALGDRAFICPIIFITAHGDIRTTVQAMRGGAVDFLTKPFDAAELLDALRRAIARSRRDHELYSRLTVLRRRAASLTLRERQVFEQVVAGLLNKQIAANLSISEKTVKVHRGRVMRKMSVRSVAQLVRAAEQLEIHGTGSRAD